MSSFSSRGDILIVDDTLDNLRLLSTMLEEQGYDVRSVTNGSTALIGIHAQLPDLVLLDINMPEMNGFEICQRLKADPATAAIPVIFISALNEVFDKVTAFSTGGVDYITKPFQVQEVLVRIENQLKLCRLQAQLQTQNAQLQQTEAELRRALAQEKALNQRIEEMAAIEERMRIAREIHDSLGHTLVALNIHQTTALRLWNEDPQKAYSFMQEAKQLGANALEAVRQSVKDMRSDPLQGKLLETAIATLVEEFHHMTGIQPTYQIQLCYSLPHQLNTALYRIVQEGLTNILKHAEAKAVQIQIQSTATEVRLTLVDDGKGFQVTAKPAGYGLRGMNERAIALGGQFTIDSQPGQGSQITVLFPIATHTLASSYL